MLAGPDLADVKGMEAAKRAVEVAAAGSHNLLLIGPPGAGKSMLACRLPGLLPDLTPSEALEVSTIHSVAGMPHGRADGEAPAVPRAAPLSEPGGAHRRWAARPPGRGQPGASRCSIPRRVARVPPPALEALRTPLETGRTTVARAAAHITYPARFQLIAAMNPCRCGHLGDRRANAARRRAVARIISAGSAAPCSTAST